MCNIPAKEQQTRHQHRDHGLLDGEVLRATGRSAVLHVECFDPPAHSAEAGGWCRHSPVVGTGRTPVMVCGEVGLLDRWGKREEGGRERCVSSVVVVGSTPGTLG